MATVGVAAAATVVAGVIGGGRRGRARHRDRLDHFDEQTGDTSEGCRDPGCVLGRGDRAESRQARKVGLGGGQADGLDVQALRRGDGVVQRRHAAFVLAVGQQDQHLVLGRRGEVLAGGDDDVVQGGVAVGHDRIDLRGEQRAVGGRRASTP